MKLVASLFCLFTSIKSLNVPTYQNLLQVRFPAMEKTIEVLKDSELVTNLRDNELFKSNIPLQLQGAQNAVEDVLKNQDISTAVKELLKSSSQVGSIISENVESSYVLGFCAFVAIITSTTWRGDALTSPYSGYRYNPTEAASYFQSRPIKYISRSAEIFLRSSGFLVGILIDFLQNKLMDPEQEKIRANQLSRLLTELGPTFIKVGQSLSIRTDLLRPAYIAGLTQLQDQVPSFPTEIALSIIEEEIGKSPNLLFLSGMGKDAKVVAAASLGQVFKAKLRDGSEVAVKVQRPGILEQVALDMHLLRSVAPIVKKVAGLQSDLEGIIDDWGRGFVDELDYLKEAENAEEFMRTLRTTPLSGLVFAPPVVAELSSRKVLTTKWIDGERLDKSSKEDITFLCSVAMNSYLTMMLEGSILHCDPHPGNLKRTPDGRLCILDWGLVTSLQPDLQQSFIEHIAHLTSKDYAQVPADLVKLGFVPPGKEKAILEQGVVEVLASIYGQWAQGGGAAKVDVNAVFTQLQGLVDKYGNIFVLPPYFAYIARAFGVLEGIGLSSNPDYAILGECLPYVSQRLLVDSDQTGAALASFIYGADSSSRQRVINTERLELLLDGYKRYSATTAQMEKKHSNSIELVEARSEQLLTILLGNSGKGATPLQLLILEEVGKILGSSVRSSWKRLRSASGALPSGRTLLGLIVDPLGLFSGSKLVESNDFDERVITSTRELGRLMLSLSPQADWLRDIDETESRQALGLLARKLWERRQNLGFLGVQLVRIMLLQTAARVDGSTNGDGSTRSVTVATVPTSHIDKLQAPQMPEQSQDSLRLKKARDLMQNINADIVN